MATGLGTAISFRHAARHSGRLRGQPAPPAVPRVAGRSWFKASYTLLATSLPLVGRTVLLLCLAAKLGAAMQGVFSHILTLATLVVALLATGVSLSVAFLVARDRRRYLGACYLVVAGYALVVAGAAALLLHGILWLFPGYVADYPASTRWLFPVLVLVSLLYLFHSQVMAGMQRFAAYFWMNFLHAALLMAGSGVLTVTGRWSVTAGLAVWLVAAVVPLPWSAVTVLRECQGAWPGRRRLARVARMLARHATGSSVATVCDTLVFRSGVVVLRMFAPFSVVGAYALAASIAEGVLQIPRGLNVFLLPRLTAARAQVTPQMQRHYRVMFAVLVLAAGVIAAAAPLLPYLLHRPEYGESVSYSRVLLLGTTLMAWSTLIVTHMRAVGAMTAVVRGSVLALVVVLAADFLLIPPFQAYGASVAAALAFASYSVYAARWLSRAAAANRSPRLAEFPSLAAE